MRMYKQVDKSHYDLSHYMSKQRWINIWHQITEIINLEPEKILEVGPGRGLLKHIVAQMGIIVETVDIDPDLNPDFVASATNLPFEEKSYDCVCAFQVLEHLPYKQSITAFGEMVRVSRKYVLISLPDSRKLWFYAFYLPKIGQFEFFIPQPQIKAPVHEFNGEHYWEIGKKGYHLKSVISDLTQNNVRLVKTFRVRENFRHRFFLFEKSEAKEKKCPDFSS